MQTFTIGFTATTAESFFERLKQAGIRRLIDVRLRNTSALAGFARKSSLEYFARAILGAEYHHLPLLAPDDALLDDYRKRGLPWADYEPRFRALMVARRVERNLDPALLEGACLLCAEKTAHQCHRRLVLEYLSQAWPKVPIAVTHL